MKLPRFNLFFLIRLAGIALFIILIARTDLRELWSWIKTVDTTCLFLAVFFQIMVLLIKAWRWYMLNEDVFSLQRLARRSGEFFEGYAMGVITPGRLGELVKAGHAGSKSGILGAGLRVIAERGMDLSIFIVVAGIAMSQSVIPGVSSFWGWVILLFGLSGMAITLLILVSPLVVRFAEKIMSLTRLLG